MGLRTIAKVLLTPLALPGLAMVLVGAGVIAAPDPKWNTFPGFWSDLVGVDLPADVFFIFIGATKVIAALSLWGIFGRFLSAIAPFALICPCVSAAYMHKEQGDPYIPGVVCAVLCLLLMVLPESSPVKQKKR
eukprot:CAMPEP_0197847328 /NCGR_PEP_ID=MMETSP1438-20131217/5716_1 /TAXON_ID=1461541 /ORGANISM="Pterosperma sp., Strain CCMP1384" /LENGTH=132 /DNA_ID=CAMNT_0043459213 /DNA_START=88 /DNA_END=486 /DNA_ORIENTATION=-